MSGRYRLCKGLFINDVITPIIRNTIFDKNRTKIESKSLRGSFRRKWGATVDRGFDHERLQRNVLQEQIMSTQNYKCFQCQILCLWKCFHLTIALIAFIDQTKEQNKLNSSRDQFPSSRKVLNRGGGNIRAETKTKTSFLFSLSKIPLKDARRLREC